MKKIFAILACFTVLGGLMFAQKAPDVAEILSSEKYDQEKTKTMIIIPTDQHITDKNATVKIEYSPLYDEVRIYYETLYVSYDRGEAMNTVLACLEDFQKENKYFGYKYLKDDRERYFRDDKKQRKAEYSSYLKFTR